MPRDREKRFDQAQFERVLRRAIDLEAAQGELLFSEEDVIIAAKELGVDESTTRAAVRELYGEAQLELDPPAGTDIVVEVADGALRVMAPPVKLNAARVAHMLFLVGWLAFVCSFTLAMGRIHLLLACLGLPFCVIGVNALIEALRHVAEWTELQLLPDRGLLNRRMGPFLRSSALDTRKLRCTVRGTKSAARPDASGQPQAAEQPFVATHIELQQAGQHFNLLAERSTPEIEWVANRLRGWLAA